MILASKEKTTTILENTNPTDITDNFSLSPLSELGCKPKQIIT